MDYWRGVARNKPQPQVRFAAVDDSGQLVLNDNLAIVTNEIAKDEEPDINKISPDEVSFISDNRYMEGRCVINVDGSTEGGNPGDGGVGITIQTYSDGIYYGYPLGSETTNQQSELEAIKYGLQLLYKAKGNSFNKVEIYSDSRYAVNCLSGEWKASSNLVEVKSGRKWLSKFDDNKTELNWVPGHSGIYFNELADRIANEAAKTQKEVQYDNYESISLR